MWAIENQNTNNNPTKNNCAGTAPLPAALHALAATPPQSGNWNDLYNSGTDVSQTTIGTVHAFPTPTIFKAQVYMGTDTEVDVFGVCNTNVNNGGKCLH